jgi:hypothetical protein
MMCFCSPWRDSPGGADQRNCSRSNKAHAIKSTVQTAIRPSTIVPADRRGHGGDLQAGNPMALTMRPTGLSSPAYKDDFDVVIYDDGEAVRAASWTSVETPTARQA